MLLIIATSIYAYSLVVARHKIRDCFIIVDRNLVSQRRYSNKLLQSYYCMPSVRLKNKMSRGFKIDAPPGPALRFAVPLFTIHCGAYSTYNVASLIGPVFGELLKIKQQKVTTYIKTSHQH